MVYHTEAQVNSARWTYSIQKTFWPSVARNNALYKNHRQATLGQKSCHLRWSAVRERKQRDDRDVTAGAYCQQGLSYRIANRSRASCAHNTLRAYIGLNIIPWPWNLNYGRSRSLETEPYTAYYWSSY